MNNEEKMLEVLEKIDEKINRQYKCLERKIEKVEKSLNQIKCDIKDFEDITNKDFSIVNNNLDKIGIELKYTKKELNLINNKILD